MKFKDLLLETTAGSLATFKLDASAVKNIDYKTIVELLKHDYEINDRGHFEVEVVLKGVSRYGYAYTINVLLHDEKAADSFGYTDEHEWSNDEDQAMSFEITVYYSYDHHCFKADYAGNGVNKLSQDEIEKLF